MILASDSQSTEASGNVKSSVEKIRPLTDFSVWGASGMGQISADLEKQLQGFKEEHPDFMAQSLASKINPVLNRHYSNFIANVPGVPPASPATSVLACGMSLEYGPWIVEVDPHCQYSRYDSKGYHAIGSGAEAAQYAISVLSHFSVKDNPIEYGKVVACRVMDTIIDTAAYYVGHPVRIWTIDQTGRTLLDDTEMQRLREAVEAWKELEKDTLLSVLKGQDAQTRASETPPPPEFEL